MFKFFKTGEGQMGEGQTDVGQIYVGQTGEVQMGLEQDITMRLEKCPELRLCNIMILSSLHDIDFV